MATFTPPARSHSQHRAGSYIRTYPCSHLHSQMTAGAGSIKPLGPAKFHTARSTYARWPSGVGAAMYGHSPKWHKAGG